LLKWTFGIGFIFVLPFGYQQLLAIDFHAFTPKAWFGFWYVLLLATYLAYYIHTAVLKHISPSISGTYVYFQPIIATIITIIFGLDALHSIKVLSALMICTLSAKEILKTAQTLSFIPQLKAFHFVNTFLNKRNSS
jgi:drug/metabolite transporter (DMT)-like permease